jgi:UDP-4-amino-4,6-dideoxy-N-acetyl-beta-L-altrosamine transaminase
MKKVINYGKQSIDNDDINAVVEVLKSDYLTQGSKTQEFEISLAKYCNAKYAVVLNSGTSALHAAYYALGLSKNDEFITTPLTFVATSNAGIYLGAKPIFSDIENDTGNIDVAKIENKITKKTKLLVPVHYAGHPADMEQIYKIAKKYNLSVVEDASHAIGSKYKNKIIGSCKYSDITTFSFHPVKHITTGEGGAILTNNKELYEKILMFRTHGITKKIEKKLEIIGNWYYEMQNLGYNYRMTDIQAALGISQLQKIDVFIEKRKRIVSLYRKAFAENEFFDIPAEKKYAKSAYHLYPIRLKDKYIHKRKEIFGNLRKNNIWVQVHYIPVHTQPYYKKHFKYNLGDFPVAENFYQRIISLPMYPAMRESDIQYVIKTVLNTINY